MQKIHIHIYFASVGIVCLDTIHHINVKATKSYSMTVFLLLQVLSLPLTNQDYSHHPSWQL